MKMRLFTKLYVPLRGTKWSTTELFVMTFVGIVIGVSMSLMYLHEFTTIKDYEIVISNFLGHKELIVVKALH